MGLITFVGVKFWCLRINDKPFPLSPEQFDYALRKKGVEKMIVIVSAPEP